MSSVAQLWQRSYGATRRVHRSVLRRAARWRAGPARAVGPLAFFPAADIWCARIAGDGVVLLGDAAGANDPSRGQGLSICFRDARELRDALLADDDWQRAIASYADRRAVYYAALRADAQWSALLTSGVGPRPTRAAPAPSTPAGSTPSWAVTAASSAPAPTGSWSTRPRASTSSARTCRLKTDGATRPLPASIADVTATWLNAALATSPAWDGARIVTLSTRTLGGAASLASAVYQATVTVETPGGAACTRQLLLKLHAPDDSRRDEDGYAAEAYFYTTFASHADVPAPLTYLAEYDAHSRRLLIVQECLSDGSIGTADGLLSLDDVERVLGSLATLHAAWWTCRP